MKSSSERISRRLEDYDPGLEQELERLIEMVAGDVSEAIEMTDQAIAKTAATISILEKSDKTYRSG